MHKLKVLSYRKYGLNGHIVIYRQSLQHVVPSIKVREIVPELSERLHVKTLRGYPCSDVFPQHLSLCVEHPCFSDDLIHDDLGKFTLDVIEFSSKSMILDISYVLCPLHNMGITESR